MRRGRWVAAVVALVLAGLMAAVAPVVVFARNQVLNEDRYVATVAPLAAEPTIQQAVADRLTTEVLGLIDVPALTQQLVTALDRPRLQALAETLAVVVNGSVEAFVAQQAERLVHSAQFQTLWTEANRIAHKAVMRALASGTGDEITVDLGRLLDAVKQLLVERGLTAAERIPQKSIPYTVAEVPGLAQARQYVKWLDRAGMWLPWIALLLLVIGLLLAPGRIRAAVVFTVTTAVLVLAVLIGSRIARGKLPSEAAMDAYDIVTRNLVTALWVEFAIAVVATVALLLVARWVASRAAKYHRAEEPVV